MRRVAASDIKRGIGFSEAQSLRVGQYLCKRAAGGICVRI